MSQIEKLNDKNIKKPAKKLIEVDSDDDVKVIKNVDVEKKNAVNVKKISGRPDKNVIYEKHRIEILSKLNKIIGCDGDSIVLILDDVNEKTKKDILALENDVKMYFKYAKWPFFKKNEDEKTYLSLMKSLYKDMGYDVRQNIDYKRDNKVITKVHKLTLIKNK